MNDIKITVSGSDTGASKAIRDVGKAGQDTQAGVNGAAKSLTDATKALQQTGQAGSTAAKGLNETAKAGADAGSSFGSITKMAAGFAGGLLAVNTAMDLVKTGFSSTVGAAASFQQALANTQSATGATAQQMAAMRAEALKIGADTSKSATQAAAAMGELVKAGVSVQTTIGGAARTVVQLSEATGAGVTEMAALVSNAMNTFKADNLTAERAANLVAKAANASAISVSDYGHAMQQVGPVAKLAGLDMEDLSAAIGILGNNALKGSDAGTSLKTMLTSLAAPTKTQRAEMERLGLSLFDSSGKVKPFIDVLGQLQRALQGASDSARAKSLDALFGSDAIRAGTILLKEGTEGWQKFKTEMSGAPDIAAQSEMRLNTLNGQVEKLKGTLETMGIAVGSKAIPALTELVKFAENVAKAAKIAGDELDKMLGKRDAQGQPRQSATAGIDKAVGDLSPTGLVQGGAQRLDAFVKSREELGKLNEIVKANEEAINKSSTRVATLATLYDQLGSSLSENLRQFQTNTEAIKVADAAKDPAKVQALTAANAKLSEEIRIQTGAMTSLDKQASGFNITLDPLGNNTAKFGLALTGASDKLTAFQYAQKLAAGQATGLSDAMQDALSASIPFSHELAEIAKEAAKTGDSFAGAAKFIDQLASSMTANQQGWNQQKSAIDSVVASAQAITTSKAPESIKIWADRAREMAANTGLAEGPLSKLNQLIGEVEQGGPGAARALDAIKTMAKDMKLPIDNADDATQKYLKATGELSKGLLAVGPSVDGLKSAIQEFTAVFLLSMGKPGPAAQSMATDVLSHVNVLASQMGAAGDNAGAALAAGLLRQRTAVANAGLALAVAAEQSAAVALEIRSPSRVFMRLGEMSGLGFVEGLEKMAKAAEDAGRDLGQASVGGLAALIAGDAAAFAPIRNATAEISRLDLAIKHLQLELANAEPMSAHAAAIQGDIDVLEAWRRKSELTRDIARANADALRGEASALSAFSASMAAAADRFALVGRFGGTGRGEGGADIVATLRQATTGDTQAGARLAEQVRAVIEAARKANIKDAEGAGAYLNWVMLGALANPSESNIQMVLDALDRVFGDINARATLNAQTFSEGMREALGVKALSDRIGADATALFAALERAQVEGGEQNIRTLTRMTAEYGGKLRELLPPDLAGRLGADFFTALNAVIESDSAQTREVLNQAAEQINVAAQLFGKGFKDASTQTQAELRSLFAAFESGGISGAQAIERAAALVKAGAEKFGDVPPVIKRHIDAAREGIRIGTLDAEEGGRRLDAVMRLIPNNIAEMSAASQQQIAAVVEAWLAGAMTMEEATGRILATTKAATEAAKQAALEAKFIADEIEDYRSRLDPVTRQFRPKDGSGPGGGSDGQPGSDASAYALRFANYLSEMFATGAQGIPTTRPAWAGSQAGLDEHGLPKAVADALGGTGPLGLSSGSIAGASAANMSGGGHSWMFDADGNVIGVAPASTSANNPTAAVTAAVQAGVRAAFEEMGDQSFVVNLDGAEIARVVAGRLTGTARVMY